jgi:MYXO-CTERM domain-containing protein
MTEMPTDKIVKVKNAGGGTLGAARATITPAVPWLAVTVDASSFTVQVKRDGLRVGQNSAVVSVSADGASAPTTLDVLVNADDSFPTPDAGVDAAGPADGGVVVDGGPDVPPSADTRAADAPATPASASGCSCSLGPTAPGGGPSLLTLALAVIIGLRRRSRGR